MNSTERLSRLGDDLKAYHIAVVIPAYRVADCIGAVIRAIPSYVRTVVVVDDASPDGLSDVVRAMHDPRVVLVGCVRNFRRASRSLSCVMLSRSLERSARAAKHFIPRCTTRFFASLSITVSSIWWLWETSYASTS
jgi:hypothetical protein